MALNVGDKVKIRSWNSMVNEYGVDCDGDIPVPSKLGGLEWFWKKKILFCGKDTVITGFCADKTLITEFVGVYLTEEMIDPRYTYGGGGNAL